MGIGLFIPPVGLGLLIACSLAKIAITQAARPLAPFLLALLLGLSVLVLVPPPTLVLPQAVGLAP